jgi:hypothetical protein
MLLDDIRWALPLQPVAQPRLEPLAPSSALMVWHIDVAFAPLRVEADRLLSNAETWNGKPLVMMTSRGSDGPPAQGLEQTADEGVAEAEIVQRFRSAGWEAYWTRGQKRWELWILRSAAARRHEFSAIDAHIRQHHPSLSHCSAGAPDIVAWDAERQALHCLEYKGPGCKDPRKLDTIKAEQVAWFETAVERGILDPNRCGVVRWQPDNDASVLLRRQAAARNRERSSAGPPDPRVVPARSTVHLNREPGRQVFSGVSGEVILFPAQVAGASRQFRQWRDEHPTSYVINLRAPRTALLHIGRCHTLGEPWPPELPMSNSKIASDSLPALELLGVTEDWRLRDCGYCSLQLAARREQMTEGR